PSRDPGGARAARLEHLGLVRHVGSGRGAPLGGAAIAQQAGGDAAIAVLPVGDDRPPRRAGAAGTRHQDERGTLAALVVVDAAEPIVDHRASFRSLKLRPGSGSSLPTCAL